MTILMCILVILACARVASTTENPREFAVALILIFLSSLAATAVIIF